MDKSGSDKDQSGIGEFTRLLFSWPSLVVVASVATLLFQGVHFKLVRPTTGDAAATAGSAIDLRVDSRSWKDPFQAVLPNVPTVKDDAGAIQLVYAASNALSSVASEFTDSKPMAILAVMVNGSPYPNAVESRIRGRVAIKSAMKVAGFVNEDSEHLRYLIHANTLDATNPAVTITNRADWTYVPYEWFKTDSTLPSTGSPYQRILLLWLREQDFRPAPFARLHSLLAHLLPDSTNSLQNLQLAILGPRTSGGLDAMISDRSFTNATIDTNATDRIASATNLLLRARILSTTATAPDAFFLKCPEGDTNLMRRVRVRKRIQENLPGSSFKHYGGTDADLCYLLVAELEMRGVDVRSDRIILMSEYDSFYGRQLPLTFKAAVMSLEKLDFKARQPASLVTAILNGCDDSTNSNAVNYCRLMARFEESLDQLRKPESPLVTNIWQYSYLSGVDGDRTIRENPKAPAKGNERNAEEDDSIDRPEGEHQLDYMGRLAVQLNGQWEGLVQSGNSTEDIKAVGVLGGDFYDKLLVLQALRPSAPAGVFFTTDLDARLNLRSQRDWTRNVITASGFGLTPVAGKNPLGQLAPMRDDYQTATFVGCLDFLSDNGAPASDLAVYEIGRMIPHRLTPPIDSGGKSMLSFPALIWSRLARAPQYATQAPTLAAGVLGYLVVLVMFMLLSANRNWRSLIGRFSLGLLCLAFPIGINAWLFNNELEPLEVGDGVSSFASSLVLCLAVTLAVYTILRYIKEDHENNDPTNAIGFIVAQVGIIALTVVVTVRAEVPFRGPSHIYFKMLLMAVWGLSGMLVIAAAFFWRRFTYDADVLRTRAVEAADTASLKTIVQDTADFAQRTRELGTLHFLPMAVLFMIPLGCNSWTDSWHWTPWMVSLFLLELLILLIYPVWLNRIAMRLWEQLDGSLTVFEDAAEGTTEGAQVRKLLNRLSYGCFAPLARQPVFAALGAALGTSGIVSLLQPMLAGH